MSYLPHSSQPVVAILIAIKVMTTVSSFFFPETLFTVWVEVDAVEVGAESRDVW